MPDDHDFGGGETQTWTIEETTLSGIAFYKLTRLYVYNSGNTRVEHSEDITSAELNFYQNI